MKDNDPSRHGEMTDEQLDQLLEAANSELLEHIEATADTGHVLTVIMDQSAWQDRPAGTTSPAASRQNPGPLLGPAAMISSRIHARALARGLAHALDLHGDIADVRDFDDELARDLAELDARCNALCGILQHSASALNVLLEVKDALNRSFALARTLTRLPTRDRAEAAARDRAEAAARELVSAIESASIYAEDLTRHLGARQVDASGADLSAIDIRQLDLLNGVIWTRETAWPAGVAAQVEEHSQEIRPGVYQVRLGDTRDRDPLTRV